jgi:hypothetical protein
MKDILEAAERLTAFLSFKLEHAAKKDGHAVHFGGHTVPVNGQPVRLFSALLHLPKGYAVTFTPRPQPEADGRWHIDVRRSDGVVRESWIRGLDVGPHEGSFAILYEGQPLNQAALTAMIADMCKPGLSGMTLDISRLYSMLFGRLDYKLVQQLESIRDVDLLDRIYSALIEDQSREAVEALIKQGAEAEAARVAQYQSIA